MLSIPRRYIKILNDTIGFFQSWIQSTAVFSGYQCKELIWYARVHRPFSCFFLLNPGWNPRKNQKWDIPSEITRPILQKPCNWAELSPYQHPDSLGFQHQESTNTTELRIRSWGQWAHGSSYSAVFPFFWYSTPIPQTVKDPQYMVPKMSPVDPIRNTCF
jgi:hypothetical protein